MTQIKCNLWIFEQCFHLSDVWGNRKMLQACSRWLPYGDCPFYSPPLFLDEQQLTSLCSYLPSLSLTHQSSFYFRNCISLKSVKANFSCVTKTRPHFNSYLQGHVPVTNSIDSQFKTEALSFLCFSDLGGAENKQMLLGCDSAACKSWRKMCEVFPSCLTHSRVIPTPTLIPHNPGSFCRLESWSWKSKVILQGPWAMP